MAAAVLNRARAAQFDPAHRCVGCPSPRMVNGRASLETLQLNAPGIGADAPFVVQVAGRRGNGENSDLCGEYHMCGVHMGYPYYTKVGGTAVIRYWSPRNVWLIDLKGLQESHVCNAFAKAEDLCHPASEKLVWYIWEKESCSHVVDAGFTVSCLPKLLQMVGREKSFGNSAINGEYTIGGLHQGRVLYRKADGRGVIRYTAARDAWLIDFSGEREDLCNAYAPASSAHSDAPLGCFPLLWHVYQAATSSFEKDDSLHLLAAPRKIELGGRRLHASNACINGTYFLSGVSDGRPIYQKPDGTKPILQYGPSNGQMPSRWYLRPDGLEEGSNTCIGFAECSENSKHPADAPHVWHIWEPCRGMHMVDTDFFVTTLPRVVQMYGRDSELENHDINGDYILMKFAQNGHPTYRKSAAAGADTSHIIYYDDHLDLWVVNADTSALPREEDPSEAERRVDPLLGGRAVTYEEMAYEHEALGRHVGPSYWQSLKASIDCAFAYANARHTEHPGYCELDWYIFDGPEGGFVLDTNVRSQAT